MCSSESFKLFIKQFVCFKILLAKTGDKAWTHFSDFILNCVEKEPEKIASFNPKKQKINVFYFNFLKSKHKELCDIRKLTLTISHGQADVERVFSLNKNREIWKR